MKQKKVPERMCVGCMEMKVKKQLVRIVRNKEGEVSLDPTGKKAGRGAYVCRNLQCLEKALKSNRLERNLSQKISKEVYEKLKEEIMSEQ